MKKKSATLESIAKKIDTMGSRFDAIDARFDSVDARFASAETGLGGRIDSLGSTVGVLSKNLTTLTLAVSELAEATYNGFARVQETLATKADKADLDRVAERLDGRIDSLDIRLGMKIDDLHEEVTGFTSDVRDDLSARITVLEKKRA